MAARKQLKPDTRQVLVSGIPALSQRHPLVVSSLWPLFGIATAKSRKRAQAHTQRATARNKLLIINGIVADRNGASSALYLFQQMDLWPCAAKTR